MKFHEIVGEFDQLLSEVHCADQRLIWATGI